MRSQLTPGQKSIIHNVFVEGTVLAVRHTYLMNLCHPDCCDQFIVYEGGHFGIYNKSKKIEGNQL